MRRILFALMMLLGGMPLVAGSQSDGWWVLVETTVTFGKNGRSGVYGNTYSGGELNHRHDGRFYHYAGSGPDERATFTSTCSPAPRTIDGGASVKFDVELACLSPDVTELAFESSASIKWDKDDVGPGAVSKAHGIIFLSLCVKAYAKDPKKRQASGTCTCKVPTCSRLGERRAFSYQACGSCTQWIYEWRRKDEPLPEVKPPPSRSAPVDEPAAVVPPKKGEPPQEKTGCRRCGKPDSNIRFNDLYGEVSIRCNDDEDDGYEYAELDTVIYENDRIKTEEESGAILGLADMSWFHIKPDTSLVIKSVESPSKLKLLGGVLWGNIKKMMKGGTIEVEMSQCVAGARGTVFALEETGTESRAWLFTSRMDVTSKKTGKSVALQPGQMARVGADGKIRVAPFDVAETARRFGIPETELAARGESEKVTTRPRAQAKSERTLGPGSISAEFFNVWYAGDETAFVAFIRRHACAASRQKFEDTREASLQTYREMRTFMSAKLNKVVAEAGLADPKVRFAAQKVDESAEDGTATVELQVRVTGRKTGASGDTTLKVKFLTIRLLREGGIWKLKL